MQDSEIFPRSYVSIQNWYAFLQAEMDYPPAVLRPSRWPRIRRWLWARTQALLWVLCIVLLCGFFAGLAALALLLTT